MPFHTVTFILVGHEFQFIRVKIPFLVYVWDTHIRRELKIGNTLRHRRLYLKTKCTYAKAGSLVKSSLVTPTLKLEGFTRVSQFM